MVAAATLLLLGTTFAQGEHPTQSRTGRPARPNTEQQTQMLIQSLKLDEATAARFTPIFKQYKGDMEAIFKQHFDPKHGHRAIGKGVGDGKPYCPTEEEIEQQILKRFSVSRAILEVRERYYKQFRTVLLPSQIRQMYNLEQGNAERMHREHMRRRPDSPSGRPNESLRK